MLSVFDLFKIGIGPSSSHTMGPMLAGRSFAGELAALGLLGAVARLQVDLFGSLALTGRGHGTDAAVLAGLELEDPEHVDPARLPARAAALRQGADLMLAGVQAVPFVYGRDLLEHKGLFLPRHANALTLTALTADGTVLHARTYYSIGGGAIRTDAGFDSPDEDYPAPPYAYDTAAQLFAHCTAHKLSVAQVVRANEEFWRSGEEVNARLDAIMTVMQEAVERGCCTDGVLPGGYRVRRRAPNLLRKVSALQAAGRRDLSLWPMLYAFAVAEENASGGRVVTAPTNGKGVDQRRGRGGAGGAAVLQKFLSARDRRRRARLSAHGRGHWPVLQVQRLHLRRAGGLPGRGGGGLFHGCRGLLRRHRRQRQAGGSGGRNRHGTQPGPDLRPRGRPGADTLH